MEKVGDKFEKSVELPDTSERIYYKVGTHESRLVSSPLVLSFPHMPAAFHKFSTNPSAGAACETPVLRHTKTSAARVVLRMCARACPPVCLSALHGLHRICYDMPCHAMWCIAVRMKATPALLSRGTDVDEDVTGPTAPRSIGKCTHCWAHTCPGEGSSRAVRGAFRGSRAWQLAACGLQLAACSFA